MRLIIKIAQEIYNRQPKNYRYLVEIWDLVDAGCFGFRRAILKFDPKKKAHLSTYATPWIRQAIARELYNRYYYTLRFPIHFHDLNNLCRKFLVKAEAYELPYDRPLKFFDGITMQEMKETISFVYNRAVDLDEEIGYQYRGCSMSENLLNEEIIADPHVRPFDEETQEFEVNSILKKIWPAANLQEREKVILCGRFGIGCKPKTLDEMGKELGLTRERIRQLQNKALKKLRRAYVKTLGQVAHFYEGKGFESRPDAAEETRGLSQTMLLERLRLIKGVSGTTFLRVLDMPFKKAKRLIVRLKKSA
jgi:RNA polymerase sigma factor (sigma-70 family)